MNGFSLRSAIEQDFPSIRTLIRRVQINPTGLDWRRFVVAVDEAGMLLGCGQLKPHGPNVLELASVAVEPEERGRGIARAIIEHLLSKASRPVYLTCRSGLGPFYEKWGFRALRTDEMPAYFRRLSQLMSLVVDVFRQDERLLVMMLK